LAAYSLLNVEELLWAAPGQRPLIRFPYGQCVNTLTHQVKQSAA